MSPSRSYPRAILRNKPKEVRKLWRKYEKDLVKWFGPSPIERLRKDWCLRGYYKAMKNALDSENVLDSSNTHSLMMKFAYVTALFKSKAFLHFSITNQFSIKFRDTIKFHLNLTDRQLERWEREYQTQVETVEMRVNEELFTSEGLQQMIAYLSLIQTNAECIFRASQLAIEHKNRQ